MRACEWILCTALIAAIPTSERAEAKPEYVELIDSIGDGHSIEICGATLDDPLPEPREVTPLKRLFDDGEDGKGIVEIDVPGRTEPITLEVKSDDDEGFCARTTVDPPLPPGIYTLRWRSTCGQQTYSPAHLRVLAPDYQGPVLISDIDLTYLQTDFQGASAMAKLVKETAAEKKPLPGMPELYGRLRARNEMPMVFMSGSPGFFRPTLEARLAIDNIHPDLLLLKPFGAIVKEQLAQGHFGGVVPALKDQVAYKVERLIGLRMVLPVGARHILLGDDSEADYIVYGVFRDLLTGALSPEVLGTRLKDQEIDAATVERIEKVAREMVERQAGAKPQVDIFIRRFPPFKDVGVDPKIRWHLDSYQLALAFYALGDLTREGVLNVGTALGEGQEGNLTRTRSARWALEYGLIDRERLLEIVSEDDLKQIEASSDWELRYPRLPDQPQ